MTKEVIIFIKALHIGEEQEEIVEEVQGTYYQKNGYHYVFYEMQENEHEFVPHMLKCKDDQVVLTKKYSIPMTMEFLENQTTQTSYQTPYGAIPLEIHTKQAKVFQEERKLIFALEYTLMTNGMEMGSCKMEIQIQSA